MARRRAKPRGGVPGPHASPGAGSVFREKSGAHAGRWRGALSWTHPLTGERKRYYVTSETEDGARRALEARRAALETALPSDRRQITVSQHLATWLRETVSGNVAIRTLETYTTCAARIEAAIGAVRLADLTLSTVEWLYREMGAAGLSASTVRLTHSVLRGALKDALRLDLIERNPTDLARLPKRLPNATERIFTAGELHTVLRLAETERHPHGALFRLLADTGLRRGEALGLAWSDIDVEARTVHVRQQLIRSASRGIELTEPKTRAAARRLRVYPGTVATLTAHRERQIAARQASRKPWPLSDLVFRTSTGRPIKPSTVDASWRRLLERAGVPHRRLHDLRHTRATAMFNAGQPAKIVQAQLGHAQIGVTMNVYTQALPPLVDAASDALEAFYWPVDATS